MKIGVYVSDNATTLKNTLFIMKKYFPKYLSFIKYIFIDNEENKELKEICKEFQIEFLEKNAKKEEVSNILYEESQRYEVDYILIFGKRILKGELLKKYKNKIINFHPAILPSFKGLRAIDQALDTDVILLGNTAHFIDENVDEGIMIMQSLISRNNIKDYFSVINLQIFMIIQIIEWLYLNKIDIINQQYTKIKDNRYEINSFIPNLENEILIKKYLEYVKEGKIIK